MTVDGALPRLDGPKSGARGLRARLNDLSVTARIALGFLLALAMVLVLALTGVATLYGVSRDVGSFSRTADLSQSAAEIDVALRGLEVAVRDHLAEGDADSLGAAQDARDGLERALERLGAEATDADDRRDVEGARAALGAYWTGVGRILDLRRERTALLSGQLEPQVQTIRDRLGALKASGGIDSATLAGDAAIAVTLMQDHLVRFVERRDAVEGERMRGQLAAARGRLVEMNRYLWVPGTQKLITEVDGLLTATAATLDRVEELLVAEDSVRADALLPNAAALAEHGAALRHRADADAAALRDGLAAGSADYLRIALWIGGVVVLVGLLTVWYVARSVSRPMRAMATAVTSLAAGGSGVALPALVRGDELGDLSRSVLALRAVAEEQEQRRALAEADLDRLRREADAFQQELIDERERAEAANGAKTDFLVNMGHELHGPLTDIVHHSQSLMSELHRLGVGELANDVDMIQWSSEQLVGLVDSILDYAKIEAGTMDICLQDFDVGRLTTEVRERLMPLADLHGNELEVAASPGLGGMQSDFGKVRQVLLNLLDNACKHTSGGRVVLSAERLERDGRSWLRFAVADTGAGFPPEQAQRFFQPFVKGSTVNGARKGGAGLGLTLVAHYCAMLGGAIELASTPGRGTRVTVLLPAVYREDDGRRRLRIDALDQPAGRPLLTVMETLPAA